MLLYPSAIIISLVAPRIVSVFAQSSSGQSVSAQCDSSLADIVASPDAQCLNVAGFAPILVGNSNASVVGPIDKWLTGMCSKNACSNQTLAAFVTNLTQGCSSDFPSLNQNTTSIVQEFYPTVRQIWCLKDSSTNQLCVVDQLYGIQNNTGTINANNLFNFVPNIITAGIPVLGLQQNPTCNNCTKEAYNIIIANIPQVITSNDNSNISNQCGASFVDGQTPAGISQTAVGNSLPKSKSSKSGTLRSFALWDGLMMLSGLGTFLAVLL